MLGGVNNNQLNFYYENDNFGFYLSSYSPLISASEAENIEKARLSTDIPFVTITLQNGFGEEEKINLVRVFPVSRIPEVYPEATSRIFMSSKIEKEELNGIEFNFLSKFSWATVINNQVIPVPPTEQLMTGSMWCLASSQLVAQFPTSTNPPELPLTDACALWKPFGFLSVDYPEDVNCDCDKECDICVDAINDESEPECPASCINYETEEISCDNLGPCQKIDNGVIINVSYSIFDCSSCYISNRECINGHFEQSRVEDVVFGLSKVDDPEFCKTKLDQCPKCTEEDMPVQWSQWTDCSSYCSRGTQTRHRDWHQLPLPCDPIDLPKHDERECLGPGKPHATRANITDFDPDDITDREGNIIILN